MGKIHYTITISADIDGEQSLRPLEVHCVVKPQPLYDLDEEPIDPDDEPCFTEEEYEQMLKDCHETFAEEEDDL